MVKREWGAKHTCVHCGVKFYDLHRSPIACPKCGTQVEVESIRPNRRRPSAQPEPVPVESKDTAGEADVDETDVNETDDDGADDIIDTIDGADDDLVDGIDDGASAQPES